MWLGTCVDKLLKKTLTDEQLLYHKIASNWLYIMGTSLGSKTRAYQIQQGNNKMYVLTVAVNTRYNILEVQMISPRIIERINTFLGKNCLSQIKTQVEKKTYLNTGTFCKVREDKKVSLHNEPEVHASIAKNTPEIRSVLTYIAQRIRDDIKM